jgi:hypothetical protein
MCSLYGQCVLREIARIGQEAQFASRKASRSQTTIEYKAKYTAAEWGLK